MDLGEELEPALAELREAAESRMRGRYRVTREDPTAPPTTDPNTGEVTHPDVQVYPDPAWPADHPHADGKGYTRYPGIAFEQNPEAGEAVFTVSRAVVRLPFGVRFRPGDVVHIDADPDNPQLVGTRLRVASIDDQSQATAQRLLCEDFQGGG